MAEININLRDINEIISTAVEEHKVYEVLTEPQIEKRKKELIDNFVSLVSQKGSLEGLKAIFDDLYGDITKRTRLDIDELATNTISHEFGEFLEIDLLGVSQSQRGGRSTPLPDIMDIFGLGSGYEVKGTGGTKNKILAVGEFTLENPEELDAIETEILVTAIGLQKVIQKMYNFFYIKVTKSLLAQRKIHYEQITLFAELIIESLKKYFGYGKRLGERAFYVDPSTWHLQPDGSYKYTVNVRLDEGTFQAFRTLNRFGIREIMQLYRIEIDLLSQLKENELIRGRVFEHLRETKLAPIV